MVLETIFDSFPGPWPREFALPEIGGSSEREAGTHRADQLNQYRDEQCTHSRTDRIR